jgi:hypothetical protein
VEVKPTRLAFLHPLQAQFVNRYGYRDERDNWVVSIDNARFVNHCCDSNTLSTGYGFEIAIRQIQPGDQITDDYGLLNLDYGMACECGSRNCRGEVGAGDLSAHHRRWDAACRHALAQFPHVPQPLLELVPAESRALVNRFAAGDEEAYRSVRCLAQSAASSIPPVLLS